MMKQSILFLFLLLFIISCSEDFDPITNTDTPINDQENLELKSGSTDYYDWTGVPLNLTIESGLSTSRKYLSVKSDGRADLHTTDDNSGRQQWYLYKTSDGYYNVKLPNGIPGKTFLSTTKDGSKVDVYSNDDGSGRQRWSLTSLGNDTYNIKIKGGVRNSRKYLSCVSDGTKVDLHTSDDGTGRQKWKFQTVDEFELIDISYSFEPGDKFVAKPTFMAEQLVINGGDVPLTKTITFTDGITETSSFNRSEGITLKLSATMSTGLPLIFEGKLNTELTTTSSWQYSESATTSKTTTFTFNMTIPPLSTYRARVYIGLYDCSASYVATFRSKRDKSIIKKVSGKWSGIQGVVDRWEVINETGTTIKSGTIIPDEPIAL